MSQETVNNQAPAKTDFCKRIACIPVPLMRFDKFCEFMGISLRTGQRMRADGYFGKLIYVENRPYISESQAYTFMCRAEAGEFDGLNKEGAEKA